MSHFTPENFSECNLGLLIGRTAVLKDMVLDTHLTEYAITAAQFKVLIIMERFGVDTPADLSRHMGLDSGSITRMLDRLEHKDLICRRRSETDRRQVQLVLKEEGLKLAGLLPHIGANAMNELLGGLEPQELQDLERILTKILLAANDSLTARWLGIRDER